MHSIEELFELFRIIGPTVRLLHSLLRTACDWGLS